MDEKAGSDNDIAGVVLGGFNAMKGFVESAKVQFSTNIQNSSSPKNGHKKS